MNPAITLLLEPPPHLTVRLSETYLNIYITNHHYKWWKNNNNVIKTHTCILMYVCMGTRPNPPLLKQPAIVACLML